MSISPTLYKAYAIGCKLAEITNANMLEEQMLSEYDPSIKQEDEVEDGSDTMRNENERKKSEQGATFGEKHQMAISPEWSGP